MQKQKLITEISKNIIKHIPSTLGVWLYGSFSKNEHSNESDIDIAFLAEESPSFEKRMEIIVSSVKLSQRDIDLIDLNTAPTVLKKEIIAYGQRIYCVDTFFCDNFENRVFADYARLNEERAGILIDIQQRGSIYG